MAETLSTILHREVVVTSSSGVRWKEITINTGASASTLQDIKVSESCGGFCFRDGDTSGLENSPARNRFIYWRANDDILELVEQSLDINLTGNHVRYRFQDTPILDGVSIHEVRHHVVVLVPTVASVHRLVFPHPAKLERREARYASDTSPLSIFFDACVASATDSKNTHMLNPSGSITAHLLTAASHITSDGDALFVLATDAGGIIQVKMPPLGAQGVVQQHELSQSSMMQKLWKGLVPVLVRGVQQDAGTATGIAIHSIHGDDFIFCVCRDHKLRMWSVKTRDCVLAYNMLEFLSSRNKTLPPVTSTSGHVIKKLIDPRNNSLKLCIHLTFPDQNQFCIVKPVYTSGRFELQHKATVFGPLEDLVDFSVSTDKLLTLWTSQSGETIARIASLAGDNDGSESWVEVMLQPPEVADILIPSFRDPRDVYLERIFHPGRFCSQDLLKALNVYRRSMDSALQPESIVNIANLREEVVSAVESEFRNCAMDIEMEEEDYHQLQLEQWSKFYSCCIQYQEVGAKVKGLFCDTVTGLVCLIRKGSVSYLRPCDKLEELYCLPQSQLSALELEDLQAPADDWSLSRDVSKLCECVRDISAEMTEELVLQFQTEAGMFESPEVIVTPMIDSLFFPPGVDSLLPTDVSDRLEEIYNLVGALRVLLKILDLSAVEDEEVMMMDDSGVGASRQLSCSQLFTSSTSSAILASSLEQFSTTRLAFCRDLLLLQVAALRMGDQFGLTADIASTIQEDLIPLTSSLVQSYLLLVWTSQAVVIGNQNTALEFNVRQLAALEISDSTNYSSSKANLPQVTLTELFIQGVGGAQGRTTLATLPGVDHRTKAVWSQHLVPLVKNIAKIIWPMSDNFLFPEFLVGSCQYVHLQEYVRLLSSWCEWNVASRRFLLGLCYLHFDEPQKAGQCFIQAGSGVGSEVFLSQKLLQTSGDEEFHKMEVLYYLKVIRQFEEFSLPDMVIYLAKTAIGVSSEDDENLPTLWSKVFKYHLELGHNEDAYKAMVANPDPSRRKDCLRQLLVVLCERGQLQALVEFPYVDLQEEVVNILESRARSVDLATHNYYNLLYSFHIFRNNFRKAGHVMYEHGMRLGRELPGLRGLQRQAQCYLAALNALRLVKPEYAWIVKPGPAASQPVVSDEEDMGVSPKHGLDGAEKDMQLSRKMEILELQDIEKEYILVDARLRLIRRNPDPSIASGPTPGPDEMVGLLVNAGLFDRAIIVAKYFDLKLTTIFENLSLRCVELAKNSNYYMIGDNDATADAWDWLQENHFNAGAVHKERSAADQAWTLLQRYLDLYEDNTARYHRCTAEKLLSHGFPLPTWFINSYKELNCAELLRVYIDYDLLEEAANLASELIAAVSDTLRGQDRTMFSLKGCLYHSPQSVWLPYVSIDQLLEALSTHREELTYSRLYQDIKTQMSVYQDQVWRLSRQLAET